MSTRTIIRLAIAGLTIFALVLPMNTQALSMPGGGETASAALGLSRLPYRSVEGDPSRVGRRDERGRQGPSPSNDDFSNAAGIPGLPYINEVDLSGATIEPGEPLSACTQSENSGNTVWYRYTPAASAQLMLQVSSANPPFVSVYTGEGLASLQLEGCSGAVAPYLIDLEAGTTYHIQMGTQAGDGGWAIFTIQNLPPPNAYFWYSPFDPSIFDPVYFHDYSEDPAGIGVDDCTWDFGDGATFDGCYNLSHRYASDGDYLVTEQVITLDGRTGSSSQTIQVRTHDVAIVKFSGPKAARAGQTKLLTVALANLRYPESVYLDLYRSTPGGYTWVESLFLEVPAGRQVTRASFAYTFTEEDASYQKVTFRVTATLAGVRDALPGDNEALSMPVLVKP